MKRSVGPMARGSVMGFFIGLLPGPAATMASFASYGMERGLSNRKEEFGKSAIEGVAGPESANNAAAGGAMIPLLSLGLPFTPSTAVLLGGMLMLGVTPGPFLLKERPDVFWGVIGSFYLGNIMLLVLNLPLVGFFARLVRISPKYLLPVVLAMCAVGTYADNTQMFDVWVMLGAGVLGYVMRKYQYEPAPLIVGMLLGPVMERSLCQMMIISQGDIGGLYASTLCKVMWVGVLISLFLPFLVRGAAAIRKAIRGDSGFSFGPS